MKTRGLVVAGAAAILLSACGTPAADNGADQRGAPAVDESESFVLIDGESRDVLQIECTDYEYMLYVRADIESIDDSFDERVEVETYMTSEGDQPWTSNLVRMTSTEAWGDDRAASVGGSDAGTAGSVTFDNTYTDMDTVPYGETVDLEFNILCSEWLESE